MSQAETQTETATAAETATDAGTDADPVPPAAASPSPSPAPSGRRDAQAGLPTLSCLLAAGLVGVDNPLRGLLAGFLWLCQAGRIEVVGDPDGYTLRPGHRTDGPLSRPDALLLDALFGAAPELVLARPADTVQVPQPPTGSLLSLARLHTATVRELRRRGLTRRLSRPGRPGSAGRPRRSGRPGRAERDRIDFLREWLQTVAGVPIAAPAAPELLPWAFLLLGDEAFRRWLAWHAPADPPGWWHWRSDPATAEPRFFLEREGFPGLLAAVIHQVGR
ncbi:hypothetical protein [Kitasatospora sp. LaBMicrA B282]|uniref:hypothetical protein n=1 Tax=Kitasatospora sp. LaBMicrA B282 TaxID=3420949 RepID=UPI003D122A54